jgi:hypothetical protein
MQNVELTHETRSRWKLGWPVEAAPADDPDAIVPAAIRAHAVAAATKERLRTFAVMTPPGPDAIEDPFLSVLPTGIYNKSSAARAASCSR